MCKCSSNGSLENKVLDVRGMSCGHCKAAVEKGISALEGVEKVQVDIEKQKVNINYYPDKIDLDRIIAALEDLGYEVVDFPDEV